MWVVQIVSQFYIGESKWPIRYRFNEHLGDARLRRLDAPLGEHVLELHADIPSSDVNNSFRIQISSADRDLPEVKIDESIHIRNLSPTLNILSTPVLGRSTRWDNLDIRHVGGRKGEGGHAICTYRWWCGPFVMRCLWSFCSATDVHAGLHTLLVVYCRNACTYYYDMLYTYIPVCVSSSMRIMMS